MTQAEAIARYGSITNGVWADAGKWVVRNDLPSQIASVLINSATKQPTTHIFVNKDIVFGLNLALCLIISRGLISELKTFDGCFEIRSVRGCPSACSCHSYAIALDFNASENQLGTIGNMSADLVKCFTDAKFDWGGNFSTRKDPMHFSMGWEGPAAA